MQALVTGGSGFIGSELIRELNRRNVKVRALMRATSSRRNLDKAVYDVAFGDLTDLESLKAASRGVDVVFHLAATVAGKSREEYFQNNSKGTENLAKACADSKIQRFIYVSSLAAGGPMLEKRPRNEMDVDQPISPYGESKLAGERELKELARGKFNTTIVRPPAVYGPRDRGIFEFFRLINSGVMPIFPASNKEGEKFYSMIHVDDLVAGIADAASENGQSENELYYLCGDGMHTWRELMQLFSTVLEKKPFRLALPSAGWTALAATYSAVGKVTGKNFPLNLDKLKELRPDYWICSNERAKQKLGFNPKFSIEDGVRNTVRWYKEHHWI